MSLHKVSKMRDKMKDNLLLLRSLKRNKERLELKKG